MEVLICVTESDEMKSVTHDFPSGSVIWSFRACHTVTQSERDSIHRVFRSLPWLTRALELSSLF